MKEKPTDRLAVPGHLRVRMLGVAQEFRKQPTRSEHLLWQALRGGRIDGLRFRRQQPIGPFIVDFFCPRYRLIIEVDGSIHEQEKERDHERQILLEACGYYVLRISAATVESDVHGIVAAIRTTIATLP